MPTKRMFDLVLITGLMLNVSINLAKLAAHRWHVENPGGFLGAVGKAIKA